MSRKGSAVLMVLLVVVIALAIIGVWYFGSQKAPQVTSLLPKTASSTTISTNLDQANSSGTYQNSELGYSFMIPSGYRIATGYIQSYNNSLGSPQTDYSTGTALNVFVTRNSIQQENATLQPSNTPNTPAYSPFPDTISVLALGVDWQSLQNLHAQLEQQGKTQPFENITLADGTQAYRYTAVNPDNNASTTEILYIPLKNNISLSNGSPVTLIVISMPQAGFDQAAFSEMMDSFRINN